MDLDKLELINKETGEVIPIATLKLIEGEWEKVFVEELAQLIGISVSGSAAKTLSWLLKNKDGKNEIHGTQREIAKKVGVDPTTVNKVMKRMEENSFLKLVRSGCYILNPNVMYFGGLGNKQAILKIWSRSGNGVIEI